MDDSNFTTQHVLLVEDDDATRLRLTQAINAHECLDVKWNCATLREGLLILKTQRPDVLLTDLGLPDGSGIELIRAARLLNDAIEIMVISVFSDERNTLEAIKAGASGYLLKDGDTAYIGDAIQRLLAGESPISPGIARHVLKSCRNANQHSLAPDESLKKQAPKLTKRETEVLQCITKGYTYHEVANILGMSHNTITSHIKNIYRKLEVHSRGEAVFEAIQCGLMDARS